MINKLLKKAENVNKSFTIISNGDKIENPAEIFNEYFINVGRKLSESYPPLLNLKKYLGLSNEH